jgi:hypothetical protein
MIRTRVKVILLPALLVAWLCCANPAAADTSGIVDISALDDGLADTPPADIEGWFLTFDPSNQWTTAANIATMESWLAVVEELGDDASVIPQVVPQLQGVIDESSSTTYSETSQSVVPEPATLELLAGALAILALCARKLCLATKGSSIPPFSTTS